MLFQQEALTMKTFAKLGDLPQFQALAARMRHEREFAQASAERARKAAPIVYRALRPLRKAS